MLSTSKRSAFDVEIFLKLFATNRSLDENDIGGQLKTNAMIKNAIPNPIPVVSNLVHTCFPKSVAFQEKRRRDGMIRMNLIMTQKFV